MGKRKDAFLTQKVDYELSADRKIIKFKNGNNTIEYVAGGKNLKIFHGNITKCKNLNNLTPQQLAYCSNINYDNASDIIELLKSNAYMHENSKYVDYTQDWFNY